MTSVLIGATGFVGSTLAGAGAYDLLVNRANLESLRGGRFDRVVCSGLPAAKWVANREPEADRANVERLCATLGHIEARRFLLISTIDVYPRTCGFDEDFDCASEPNHAYGSNRLACERFVRERFPHAHIVRLPALFGPGMKKNIVFDLLHDNALAAINPDSSFQWYPVTRLAADLEIVERRGLPLVNLFTAPVSTRELLDRFFPGKQGVGSAPGAAAHYDLRTRYAALFGGSDGYCMGRDDVLAAIGAFVETQRHGP